MGTKKSLFSLVFAEKIEQVPLPERLQEGQTLQGFLQVPDELGHAGAPVGERVPDAAVAVGLNLFSHEPRPDQAPEAAGSRGWAPHKPLELREIHRPLVGEGAQDSHRSPPRDDVNLQRTPAEKVYRVQFNRSCPKCVSDTLFVFIGEHIKKVWKEARWR